MKIVQDLRSCWVLANILGRKKDRQERRGGGGSHKQNADNIQTRWDEAASIEEEVIPGPPSWWPGMDGVVVCYGR